MKYSLPESLSTSKDISLCHRVDIRLMAFEYEVYAVDQLAGNFHDGLARYHPLGVVQVAELHRSSLRMATQAASMMLLRRMACFRRVMSPTPSCSPLEWHIGIIPT